MSNSAPAKGGTGLRYKVEADGAMVGYFTEVSGLGSETEVVGSGPRVGGAPILSGMIMDGPSAAGGKIVHFAGGSNLSPTLSQWLRNGNKRTVQVTQVNVIGAPIKRWRLTNAQPSQSGGAGILVLGYDRKHRL